MALPKLFNLITWHNNTTPAINEDNLNAMSNAIDDIDDRVIGLAGTIMEDVPQIQEDLEILEPAIENIDSNVARAETAADDAEDSAETAEYWANVSNPPIPVTKDFASVITVDDAIPKAATDVKVKVEAVQDLHGYDKPWVGGAGKNKLPMTVESIKSANSGTWSGNSIVKNGVTWTILTDSDGNVTGIKANGTASANSEFNLFDSTSVLPNGSYILSGGVSNNVRIFLYDGSTYYDSRPSEVSFTLNNPSRVRCTCVVVNGNTASNAIFYPMIRLSTVSDSTFEQYENICPISGFTEVNLPRTGKNLCYNSLGGYVVITNGVGKYETNASLTSLVFDCKANTSYTISGVTGKNRCVWGVFDTVPSNNDTTNYCANAGDTTNTITPTKSGVCVVYVANSVVDTSNAQIEKGNQVTPYEPYNGTTYIIDLNGTRYGATLDVTSGVMTVDTVILTAPTTTTSWNTSATTGRYLISLPDGLKTSDAIVKSSHYEIGSTTYGVYADTNGTYLRAGFNTVDFATVSDWCAYLTAQQTAGTPVTLTYKLATPITVNLTPKEVQMLQGYNVLSANSGDVYLEYDASMIQRIANEKLDISTFKSVVASSSDFADFKTKVAAL